MDFSDCVMECARNDDFIREFNRLTGCHFGKSLDRKPIEIMVDKATGYSGESHEDIVRFIQFVWEFVWCTLPEESFADSDIR